MLWRNLDWVPMVDFCTAWSILYFFPSNCSLHFLWFCFFLFIFHLWELQFFKGLTDMECLRAEKTVNHLCHFRVWSLSVKTLILWWMALILIPRHLEDNLDDWLTEELDNYLDDDYLVFDCPGIHTNTACFVVCIYYHAQVVEIYWWKADYNEVKVFYQSNCIKRKKLKWWSFL